MKDSGSFALDAFQLKMLAILAMVLDHVGVVFFPALIMFRVVGRITVPIMAFFIAEGYTKTRNVKRYMLRLLAFAVISMLPYAWVFGGSPFNILFDLLLGLWVIDLSQKLIKDYQKWLVVICAASVALLLKTDGQWGVSTLVYLFYRYRKDKRKMALTMSLLYLGVLGLMVSFSLAMGQTVHLMSYSLWLRPLSLLALPLIFCYNGERGKNLKYLFYAFYPVHLLVILAFRYIL